MKSPERDVCARWKTGKCKRGNECYFRHPNSLKRKEDKNNFGENSVGYESWNIDGGHDVFKKQLSRGSLCKSLSFENQNDEIDKEITSPNPGSVFWKPSSQPLSLSPTLNLDSQKEAARLWDWCKDELWKIQRMPEASMFLEPVDWKKLKLPLYPNIIKKPMDLSTISRGAAKKPTKFNEF